jgi:hypothetical protein
VADDQRRLERCRRGDVRAFDAPDEDDCRARDCSDRCNVSRFSLVSRRCGVGSDVVERTGMATRRSDRQPLAEARLDDSTDIWLSPSGAFVAYSKETPDERHELFAGPIGGPFQRFDADTAVFAGDHLLVAMQVDYDHALTRRQFVSLPEFRVTAQTELRDVIGTSVAVNPPAGSWQVLGEGKDDKKVRVRGSSSGEVLDRTTWTFDAEGFPIGANDDMLLALTNEYANRSNTVSAWWRTLRGERSRAALRVVGSAGVVAEITSAFDVDCSGNTLIDGDALCMAYDGSRTHVVTVDVATLALTPQLVISGFASADWIRGSAASASARDAVGLDLAGRRLFEAASEDYVWRLMLSDRVLGVVTHDGEHDFVPVFGLK